MASKAHRSSLWVHALGQFAEGAGKSLDRKNAHQDKLEEILARNAIEQATAKIKQDQDASEFALKIAAERRRIKQAGVGSAVQMPDGSWVKSDPLGAEDSDALMDNLDTLGASKGAVLPPIARRSVPPVPALAAPPAAPTGPQAQTIPGVKAVSVRPGATNIPKSTFLKNPDKYQNTPNLNIVPDTSATTSDPRSIGPMLDQLDAVLKDIPTDLKTTGTVGAAKLLGGEREVMGMKFGSDAAKKYEDFKPGTAVSVYRSITGDTRLSDADASARAVPYMPYVFPVMDTMGVRTWKMVRIREAAKVSAQMRTQNPGQEVDFGAAMAQAEQSLRSQGITPEVMEQQGAGIPPEHKAFLEQKFGPGVKITPRKK